MTYADLIDSFPYSIMTTVRNGNLRGYTAMYRPRYRDIQINDDLTRGRVKVLTVRDMDTPAKQLAEATATLLRWSSDRSTVRPFRVLGINA